MCKQMCSEVDDYRFTTGPNFTKLTAEEKALVMITMVHLDYMLFENDLPPVMVRSVRHLLSDFPSIHSRSSFIVVSANVASSSGTFSDSNNMQDPNNQSGVIICTLCQIYCCGCCCPVV